MATPTPTNPTDSSNPFDPNTAVPIQPRGTFIPDPAAANPLDDPDFGKPRSALGEIGAGLARFVPSAVGSVADTMAGQAEMRGEKPGPVTSAVSDWAKRKLDENAAQTDSHGPVTNFVSGIPEAIGGSAAMIGANVVGDVTPVPLAAGAFTGAQQYAERYHTALAEAKAGGKNDDDATTYAKQQASESGAIGAAFGELGPLGMAGKVGARALGVGAKTASQAAEGVLKKSFGKELAAKAAVGQGILTGANAGQAALTASDKQDAGLPTESPMSAAISSIPGSFQAGVGFLPFHALSAHTDVTHATNTAKALADPKSPDRATAVRAVYDAMEKQDPEGANMWAINAGEALHAKQPIGVDDSWTAGPHASVFPEAAPEGPLTAAVAPTTTEDSVSMPTQVDGQRQQRAAELGVQADHPYVDESLAARAPGPLSEAAGVGRDSGAVDQKAAERQAEIDQDQSTDSSKKAEPTGTPEDQQARANIASWTRNSDGIPLADAQRHAAAIEETGKDYTVVPSPNGDGYAVVPDHLITPEIKEQHAGLQSDSQEPAPEGVSRMPFATPEAARARAEELTSQTGREYEAVPHPLAREKYAVQEREQAPEVSTRYITDDEQAVLDQGVDGKESSLDNPHGEPPLGRPIDIDYKADAETHATPSGKLTKLFGAPDSYIAMEKGALQLHPEHARVVSAAIKNLIDKLGVPKAFLDGLSPFHSYSGQRGEGRYFAGSDSIGIHNAILNAVHDGDKNWAQTLRGILMHELLHHVDNTDAYHFSSTKSKAFEINTDRDGLRQPTGGIVREAMEQFAHGPKELSEYLKYPFGLWDHPENIVSSSTLQEEVFAQLGRLHYTNPEMLKRYMPLAHDLFKEIHHGIERAGNIDEARRAVLEAVRARGTDGRVTDKVDRGTEPAIARGDRQRKAGAGLGRSTVEQRDPGAADTGAAGVSGKRSPEVSEPEVLARPTGFPVGGFHAIDAATGRNLGHTKDGENSKRFPTPEAAIAFGQKTLAAERKADVRNVKDDTKVAPQTVTPEFKKWFGESKVVDKDGAPLRVYHGTTNDFSEFDQAKANPESDFGAGFYFSNTPKDVAHNYASSKGPDLGSKIERRAEQIHQEMFDGKTEPKYGSPKYIKSWNEAREQARTEFAEHDGATVPVYLSIRKPLIVGGDKETFLDFEHKYDKDGEPLDEEPTGKLADLLDAVQNVASRYDDAKPHEAVQDVMERYGYDGGGKASDIIEALRKSDGLQYATDDSGSMASNEIIRKAIELAGFDGIIDRSVDKKFGSQRRTGKSMAGMNEGTVHYIAFQPEQIKSATGNRGTFDATNKDIRYVKDDDGGKFTAVRASELLAKMTGGKGAEAEQQFTKSGELVREADRGAQPISDTNKPDWVAKASPEAQAFLQKAGVWVAKKSWRERWTDIKKDMGLKILQQTVDQYRPVLERIGREAYQMLRMASASDNGLAALVQDGHVAMSKYGTLSVKADTKSLRQIMAPLMGEHDRMLAYLAALRSNELMKPTAEFPNGREHNFTPEEVKAGLKLNTEMHADDKWKGEGSRAMAYANAIKEFGEMNKSVLDVGEAGGVVGKEARKLFESEYYVNFRREKGDEPAFDAANVSGMVNVKGIQRLQGGENQLHDLVTNTMNNWSGILASAMKNNAARETLKQAEALGIAEKVSADTKGAVYIMEDGKQVHYLITDKLVSQAISSLGAVPMRGPIMKGLSAMKHALTIGTTWSPIFRIRHTIREQITALAANPTGYNPVKNWIDGLKYSSKNNPEYGNMAAGGAFFNLGLDLEGNRAAYVKRLIAHEIDPKTLVDSEHRALQMWRHSIDWWKEVGERSDSITRANLYRQTFSRMIADGHDPDRAHFEASYVARDAMDYSLHGTNAAIRMITQVVPFANARMQGIYKLGRGAADDPKRFAAVIGGVTLATIALSLAQRNNKNVQNASEWDRDNNWLIAIGDTMYRVPKPFEVGAMATVADRALEVAMNGFQPADRERFAARLLPIIGQQLSLNPIPQAVFPALQLWANHDVFRGAPIEPQRDEKLSSAQHIGPNTSLTAQLLGKAQSAIGIEKVALSPQQIDFAVASYLGWIGTHAVATADLALRATGQFPTKAAMRIDDYFVVGDFAHSLPADQSRFVEQYYKHMQDVQTAFGDMRMLQQTGQFQKAAEVMKEKGQNIQLHGLYLHTQREIGKLNLRERYINMRTMDPDEKRTELDRIAQIKSRLAEVAETTRAAGMNRR